MFLSSLNSFIDTVQGAKSTFVKNFIKDESLAKPIQAFVDSQTAFVKQVAETTFAVATESAKQVASFDAAKVFSVKK